MAFLEMISASDGPLTLAIAKAHGRIRTDKEDDLIQLYLDGVVEFAEDFIGLDIRDKEYKQTGSQLGACVTLEASQVKSVASIKYKKNGALVVIPEAEYQLYKKLNLSTVNAVSNGSFPVMFPAGDGGPDGYEIVFSTGWVNMPAQLKNAILNHFMFFYENRGDAIAAGASAGSGLISMPPETERIYKQFRILRV